MSAVSLADHVCRECRGSGEQDDEQSGHRACAACGGTGDRFDNETNDWWKPSARPRKPMVVDFDSRVRVVGGFGVDVAWSDEVVKNEPMLFNCTIDAAYRLGGPITRQFLELMPEDWRQAEAVVDSRVHMLKPGWMPCIGGWHLDDVPRDPEHGQPLFDRPPYRTRHLMGLVNAEICPTQFAFGQFSLEVPEPPEVVYRVWDREIDRRLFEGREVTYWNAPSGAIIEFDDRSFHQGTAAIASGWRWFIRVSRNTDRTKRCTNEVRRQVQVYLDTKAGW